MEQVVTNNANKKSRWIWLALILLVLIFVGLTTLLFKPAPTPLEEEGQFDPKAGYRISEELQDKARAAGYKIVYQGAEEDKSGRSVLVNASETIGNGWNDLNTSKTPIVLQGEEEPSNILDYYVLNGIVWNTTKIPETSDYYLTLYNPFLDQEFKFRLYSAVTKLEENLFVITSLVSYDLSDPEVDPLWIGDLNYFSAEQVEKLIKPGDAITIRTVPVSKQSVDKLSRGVWVDSSGAYAASWLMIRRFGGREEVEKELAEINY